MNLFESPIKQKEVRKGVIAYQYRSGVINICGNRYLMHSMTSAINSFRKEYPAK
jgi:hypothetical protein